MHCNRVILLSAFCGLVSVEIADAAKRSFYDILGVNRDATDRQIKKAFRKLALIYHPDKNKDNPEKAQKQFVEIAQAYETLSDPDKRKQYDMFGEDYDKNGGGANSHGFNFNFDDFFKGFDNSFFSHDGDDDGDFTFSFGGPQENAFNFDDLFSDDDGGEDFFEFNPFGDAGFGENLFDNFDDMFNHDDIHTQHKNLHNAHRQHHQAQHMKAHQQHQHSTVKQGGRSCRTVTTRIGNMVTTHTECS